jgi:hypothetical protein
MSDHSVAAYPKSTRVPSVDAVGPATHFGSLRVKQLHQHFEAAPSRPVELGVSYRTDPVMSWRDESGPRG